MNSEDKKYHLTKNYCRLREMEFGYNGENSTDSNPRVLVTSQNQHEVRGFNLNYMGKVTENRIKKEWRMVQNQPWSTQTKERVVLKRLGGKAQKSFRSYKTGFII
tara:strand:- start:5381 stop:5695 length:315 start_codon:yes stop_codon:yes gene_type:complete